MHKHLLKISMLEIIRIQFTDPTKETNWLPLAAIQGSFCCRIAQCNIVFNFTNTLIFLLVEHRFQHLYYNITLTRLNFSVSSCIENLQLHTSVFAILIISHDPAAFLHKLDASFAVSNSSCLKIAMHKVKLVIVVNKLFQCTASSCLSKYNRLGTKLSGGMCALPWSSK